ncbi:MAG: CocE/NonD family hydrolase, partial [Nocardioidaceae bacterium]
VTVPVSSVGGWYDIFLPGQIRDFQIMQEAGRPARLTIGPWTHLSMDGTATHEAVDFGLHTPAANSHRSVPRCACT